MSGQHNAFAALPPGKNLGTHWIGGWGWGPRSGLDILEIRMSCHCHDSNARPSNPIGWLNGHVQIPWTVSDLRCQPIHFWVFPDGLASSRLSLCVVRMYLWVPLLFLGGVSIPGFVSLYKYVGNSLCKIDVKHVWLQLCRVYVHQGHCSAPDPVPVCGAEFGVPCPLLGQFVLCWDCQQTGSANGHCSWPDTWHICAGTWRNTCSYYWWCCTQHQRWGHVHHWNIARWGNNPSLSILDMWIFPLWRLNRIQWANYTAPCRKFVCILALKSSCLYIVLCFGSLADCGLL